MDNQENKIVSAPGTQFEPQDIRNTILVQLSWTHHRTIFSRCKTEEEREFYIRMSIKENYSVRELDRQISASLFERTMIGNTRLSKKAKEIHADITNTLKDSYVFEFLNLQEPYNESDLKKGLIRQNAALQRQRKRSGGIRFEPKPFACNDFGVQNAITG